MGRDRGHVAVMDYSDEDYERRGENDDMDDLGEDFESDNDDDEEDESDDGIASDDEEEEEEEINYEIMKKIMRTFHNGDYDQEFDDALSSDRSAVVPITRPSQASYNKPDNWRERNRIGLEKVKRQLLTCIDSMTHDAHFTLSLRHNGTGDQLMDNEEQIVWHDPILDEYWNRLEAKMNQLDIDTKIGTDVSGIHIENVEMKKERLATLVNFFISGRANNSSSFVEFDNANLCADGIISLSEYVDVSSELHTFCLYHNRIDNMESACCLSRSLKSHTGINQLWLTHCDLGSNPEILLVILQSDVSHIILDNNNIDSLGAVNIAEYLEGNPPIEVMSLDHNHLNDDDALLISQALKRNTNLISICLCSNNLTSIGVKALLTCAFDGSSLNAIAESNHTLERLVLFSRQTNVSLVDSIDRMLALNRMQKIVLALNGKDSLLKYLANVPLELIPEVFAFPHGRQPVYLDLVYSTMRWWNMPLLYSYYICVKSDTKRKREMTV